ncbi:hypothetical protein FRZ61_20220 [Hypericibacter adhaerens]|uniref:O-antigen ligase-related domain-containing protein n=1 Tax=Hypericibacter adhaerens TaxID=2602016 RepID=A0A5J6MYQ8_9PROT|nr:O-antigen ligase family protein [Hypericibacter adhaerens]QEX22093.1 hypothetical protein FRZ61_20220 [Hypericibacter adhaerens]
MSGSWSLFTATGALEPRVIERAAPASLALILLYAACLAIGNGPGNVLLAILGISALPSLLLRPELRRRPIVVFSALVILYLLAMALRAELDGAPGKHFRAVDNYAFFAYVPFVAVHVAIALRYRIGFERLCCLVVAGLVAGAAARLFWDANWQAGAALFDSYQWGGGGKNRNYLSIEAGLTVLASGSLLVMTLIQGRWHPALRLLGGVALAVICVLAFLALLEMKSRTNWIAAAIAMTVWLAVLVAGLLRHSRRRRAIAAAVVLAFAALIAAGLAAFSGQIASRFSDNGGVAANIGLFARIFAGEIDPASTDLHGYDPRAYIYVAAGKLIAEKPWFGWGTDLAPLVNQSVDASVQGARSHFHNAYLEFLVGLGIVGTILIAAHLLAIVVACRRPNAPPLDLEAGAVLAALLAGSLTYIAVVGFAESANRVELITQTLILVFAVLLGRGSLGEAMASLPGSARSAQ